MKIQMNLQMHLPEQFNCHRDMGPKQDMGPEVRRGTYLADPVPADSSS